MPPKSSHSLKLQLPATRNSTTSPGAKLRGASSPLMGDVVGDLIYFPMTFSGAEYARDVLAEIAASLGLVCYDPQIECLLPDVDAAPASVISTQAGAALVTYLEQRDADSDRRGWLRRTFGRNR